MAALRNFLLALLLAAIAAVPSPVPARTVAAKQVPAEDLGADAEFALSDAEFAEGTDETERDDEEDLATEMDHVDELLLSGAMALTSLSRSSTSAPERGDAGKCVPACYRHGKLMHKPKVKCDRFICKACAECFQKPSGSSACYNGYSSMITRVKHDHAEISNCDGKADSLSSDACKVKSGKEAFDLCDILGEKCAGILTSHSAGNVVLKGPYVESDIKKGESKWFMCVK